MTIFLRYLAAEIFTREYFLQIVEANELIPRDSHYFTHFLACVGTGQKVEMESFIGIWRRRTFATGQKFKQFYYDGNFFCNFISFQSLEDGKLFELKSLVITRDSVSKFAVQIIFKKETLNCT